MTGVAKESDDELASSKISLTDDSDHALQEWYREYKESSGERMWWDSPLIEAVQHDTLNDSEIEESIQKASKTVHVENGFCTSCRDMFNNWPTIGIKHGAHGIARHVSTTEMEAARRKGCKCCTFILSRVDTHTLNTYRKFEKRLAILGSSESCSISVWNWGSVGSAQCLWVNLPGKIMTDVNTGLAARWGFESQAAPPGANPDDELAEQLDHAKSWLHKCTQDHERCKSKSTAERPRRLVRIADGRIRLVLTETMSAVPRYATLSYCWGKKDFINLTRENLERFLIEIPGEELPKTFADAVFTARALGLQYIWIDSLCIIQGESDHLDWISESGKMRSVYGSAYVNIAATTATDVHEGFLTKDPNYSGGFVARVSTRKMCWVRNFHSRDVYNAATSKTYLATRAWTLQERLLAPRTIYLGKQGLFCECRATWISEYLPWGCPGILATKLVVPETTPWDWGEIVRWYSAAKMTKPSDKLPALSGIARRQHEATGDHYLAGMWKHKFLRQLVWSCYEKGERPEWRAPSWSWTSIDARTYYWGYWQSGPESDPGPTIGSDEFVRVLDVWTTPAGSDPFGAITDGELRLGCRALIYGCFSRTENEDETGDIVIVDTSEEKFSLRMDTKDDELIKPGETLILLPILGGRSGTSGYNISNAEELQKTHSAVREPELSEEEHSDSDWGEAEWEEIFVTGLVLSPQPKRGGEFQRVGSFYFVHEKPFVGPDSKEDQYTEFMRVMQDFGPATAASWCAETLSDFDSHDMPYVITIR